MDERFYLSDLLLATDVSCLVVHGAAAEDVVVVVGGRAVEAGYPFTT